MSDTPRDQGEGADSGDAREYRDPTAPTWSEGSQPPSETEGQAESTPEVTWSSGGDDTRALPSESTQHLPSEPLVPPTASEGQTSSEPGDQAQSPYGQAPSPYGTAAAQPPNPYGQTPGPYGQPPSPYAGGQQGVRPPGAPGAPGAPGVPGSGYPYGGQPAYGQQPSYGPPAGQGYGQPSPYARPQQTNASAIVLLIVSGLSTLSLCIFAIPALILSIMALSKQNQSPAESAKYTRWGWIAYAVAIALTVLLVIIGFAIFASVDTNSGY